MSWNWSGFQDNWWTQMNSILPMSTWSNHGSFHLVGGPGLHMGWNWPRIIRGGWQPWQVMCNCSVPTPHNDTERVGITSWQIIQSLHWSMIWLKMVGMNKWDRHYKRLSHCNRTKPRNSFGPSKNAPNTTQPPTRFPLVAKVGFHCMPLPPQMLVNYQQRLQWKYLIAFQRTIGKLRPSVSQKRSSWVLEQRNFHMVGSLVIPGLFHFLHLCVWVELQHTKGEVHAPWKEPASCICTYNIAIDVLANISKFIRRLSWSSFRYMIYLCWYFLIWGLCSKNQSNWIMLVYIICKSPAIFYIAWCRLKEACLEGMKMEASMPAKRCNTTSWGIVWESYRHIGTFEIIETPEWRTLYGVWWNRCFDFYFALG